MGEGEKAVVKVENPNGLTQGQIDAFLEALAQVESEDVPSQFDSKP